MTLIGLTAALQCGSDDCDLCLLTSQVSLTADGSGVAKLHVAMQALHAPRLIDHAARASHAGRAGRSAPYPDGQFLLEGLPQARPFVIASPRDEEQFTRRRLQTGFWSATRLPSQSEELLPTAPSRFACSGPSNSTGERPVRLTLTEGNYLARTLHSRPPDPPFSGAAYCGSSCPSPPRPS